MKKNIVKTIAMTFLLFPLLLNNLFVASAQSRSVSPNLIGTEWEVTFILPAGTVQCSYVFAIQGKVTSECLAITAPGTMAGANINDPMFNPMADRPFKPKLVTTPMGSASSKAIGTYTQNGSSIRIEFSDAVVTGTINNNILSGQFIYKDTSEGKLEWVMRKLTNNEALGAAVPSKEAVVSQVPTSLSKQVIDKYNPTPLATEIISGRLRSADNITNHYYSFMAGPGEIGFTLYVEADAQSYYNSVEVDLFDNNERLMGSALTMSNFGRTTQVVKRINLPKKQPVLFRVQEAHNSGSGKYRVQFDGAFETQADYERLSSIAGPSVDKRSTAERISAYIDQGNVKMNLQDYQGAIKDFTSAIELLRRTSAQSREAIFKSRCCCAVNGRLQRGRSRCDERSNCGLQL